MNHLHQYGEWAIVFGGACGLGKEFARTLASSNKNLVLYDNNESELNATVSELVECYAVKIESRVLDLSDLSYLSVCLNDIQKHTVRLLVFNAAYGPVKEFHKHSSEEIDLMINLHNRSLSHIMHHICQELNSDLKTGVICMSSLAAIVAPPYVAPYAASKAYILNFAQALHQEYHQKGLDILACCAGMIDTEAWRKTGAELSPTMPKPMHPREVARLACQSIGSRVVLVPGKSNRISDWLFRRIFSRKQAAAIVRRSMQAMYGKQMTDPA